MDKDFYKWNTAETDFDKYSKTITGDNYIYIFHLPNGKNTGEGTYVYLPQWPDQISDSLGSTFNSSTALSRSAPVYSYANSGPREVNISVQLHRDMMDEANRHVQGVLLEDMEDYVDWVVRTLQAVALPNYHGVTKEVEPPMVAVRFGNELFIKGVVNGGITVEYQKPLLVNNKYAQVNISFKVSEVDPMDAVSIQKVGSFRNISKSYRNIIGGN